jgi:N-acetyl-gamma-glutamyl-phosphate reductase
MTRVAIVGAGGYTGAELVEILLAHPAVELVGLFASEKRAASSERFSDLFPRFAGRVDEVLLPTEVDAIAARHAEVVFLATPHEASLELAPALLARGITVFDLSAAFRLRDAALYPKHYGFPHTHADLLASAVYGLPELFRAALRENPALVAVPGCYPTASILALRPLAEAGALEPGRRAIIDATSGVSGAGRSPSLKVHFCELSLQAYNVLAHRHNPEIDAYVGAPTLFTPHLGAFDRGILATIHADLAPGWSAERVRKLYEARYASERFVQVLPAGRWPSIGAVRGTNLCHLGLAVDEAHRHVVLSSAIDNLVKGASGQAVQALNCVLGLDEGTALRGGLL